MTANDPPGGFSLWSPDVERDMLTDSTFATIYCDPAKGGCGTTERAVFRGSSDKCPSCDQRALAVTEFNQRNAIVADSGERFAHRVFTQTIENSTVLSGNYFAKRNVRCPELELRGRSAADLAILGQDIYGPATPSQVACVIEVKMSVIWNWSEGQADLPTADYDGHAGRPSIYRTDSILKAIGKAAITRSCAGSEHIPFIVVGNTPPPLNYRDKVDGTVKAGLIQKWLSLTPNPLIVEPTQSPAERNPKRTEGFLRIDNIAELQQFLEVLLAKDWQYIGAMVELAKLGEIIKSIDQSQEPEEIGRQFLRRLPAASTASVL